MGKYYTIIICVSLLAVLGIIYSTDQVRINAIKNNECGVDTTGKSLHYNSNNNIYVLLS